MTKSKNYIYNIWNNIKLRCYFPKSKNYKNCGALGIKMFEPWLEDFSAFEDWILINLGPKPESKFLCRKDVTKNFEPGNLFWATSTERSELKTCKGGKPKKVYKYTLQREFIKEYNSATEAAKDLNKHYRDAVRKISAAAKTQTEVFKYLWKEVNE